MVDVTSLHIGISINAINSCLTVAIPPVSPAPVPSPLLSAPSWIWITGTEILLRDMLIVPEVEADVEGSA